MASLFNTKTRNIIGFERYENDNNEVSYNMVHFDGFYFANDGTRTNASAEEIMIAANILHCLQQSGVNPDTVILYQDATAEEWYNAGSEVDVPIRVAIR